MVVDSRFIMADQPFPAYYYVSILVLDLFACSGDQIPGRRPRS